MEERRIEDRRIARLFGLILGGLLTCSLALNAFASRKSNSGPCAAMPQRTGGNPKSDFAIGYAILKAQEPLRLRA